MNLRTYFFYGCTLLITMYFLGHTVIFPWAAFLDDGDGYGSGGYSRGGYSSGGGFHK